MSRPAHWRIWCEPCYLIVEVVMQKLVLLSEDGQSRLLEGDSERERLSGSGMETRALPILLTDGWRVVSATPANETFLVLLEKG